jgi:hypothetical protein
MKDFKSTGTIIVPVPLLKNIPMNGIGGVGLYV